MKFALITLIAFLLSSQLLAGTEVLSYRDSIQLKKTTVTKNLPVNFLKLYRAVSLEDKRMIAGEFDISEGKSEKKTYMDGLRSKLQGCKGFARF